MGKFRLIIKFFLIMLFMVAQTAFGADFRVVSANYDLSNAIVVLSAKDSIEGNIAENINLKKLENPTRYYFDLDSTVLTIPKQDWVFRNGNFDRILISQFQNNPNIVRVVFYPKEDKIFKDIKFYRIKNNIIMRLNGNDIQNDYYQHIYRDEHASSSDFYENLKVVYSEPLSPVNMADEIQNAFNVTPAQPPAQQKDEPDFKRFKLNTKYYMNNVTARPNSILLSGFGEMTFEKPTVLTNPTRLIYDFPNSLSAPEVRNREYQINETDKIVIGQFSINKVRAVIYTENVENYVPVLAADNQSVLFINQKTYDMAQLVQSFAKTIQYQAQEINDLTQSMTLNFDAPIVHSIDRKNNALVVTIFNAINFNEEEFKSNFAGSFFWNAKLICNEKGAGVRIYIPLRQDSQVNTYLGADGKSIKVVLKETNRSKKQLFNIPTSKIPSKTIIIDAGHGGTDYGAIRGDVNEKTITLDVAKKVQKELTKLGHKVIMTRSTDDYISLQDRVDISAQNKGEIFVSIHVNSSVKPEIEGIETHYYHQESMGLAQVVHESLISNLKPFDRGLFKSKFYVINHTEIPAILCEIGFISNDEERKLLVTEKRKQETAKAIVEGVLKYFGQE
ncbi:MAG: N-acetylmuramoyl-L-alanine amidase [Fusobacterium sp.]|nr:N-acetylmuramoyl-L-alanine amidase [Fusobacterium sp.]